MSSKQGVLAEILRRLPEGVGEMAWRLEILVGCFGYGLCWDDCRKGEIDYAPAKMVDSGVRRMRSGPQLLPRDALASRRFDDTLVALDEDPDAGASHVPVFRRGEHERAARRGQEAYRNSNACHAHGSGVGPFSHADDDRLHERED